MEYYTKPTEAKDLFYHIKYQDYPYTHTHDYWEFVLVLKGTIIHKINGETRVMSEGTLCLIRPHDVHSLHNKKREMSQHLNLGITAPYFQKYLEAISPDLYEELENTAMPREFVLSPAKVNSIFNSVKKVLSADKSQYEMQIRLLFMDVLREFYSESIKNVNAKNTYSPCVARLIILMSKPENMKLRAIDLIKDGNYSYSHTNRIFMQEVGCTPNHFFRDKKLEYAKTLIGETDMSLIDISLAIGYENYPYFSSAFKKYTGVSPVKYNRNQRSYYKNGEE